MASVSKSQIYRELSMQEIAVNSIGALTGSERMDGCIAALQLKAKRRLSHIVSNLFSSRSLNNELVVVGLVVVIILRTSG
jgi:hypothetical protein